MLSTFTGRLASIAALTIALVGSPVLAQEVKLPTTAEEHATMSKLYEEKAAEWRKEAAYHRQMAAAYHRSHPELKGGRPNPAAKKMEKHCMDIVTGAEKLAKDADASAPYHKHRADELQGK